MSAFGGKADMDRAGWLRPLLTQTDLPGQSS